MNRRWLERLMESRGVTYYQLKEKFHVSPDTFKNWEAGMVPRPDTLRRLADILDVEYPDLVKGLGVKPVKPVPPANGFGKRGKKVRA